MVSKMKAEISVADAVLKPAEAIATTEIQKTAEILKAVSPAPYAEARHIFNYLSAFNQLSGCRAELGFSHNHNFSHNTAEAGLSLDEILEKRLRHEPIQYIFKSWQFRHLELYLDSRVLIPRPETEITVEKALNCLSQLQDLSSHYQEDYRQDFAVLKNSSATEDLNNSSVAEEKPALVKEGNAFTEEKPALKVLDLGCGSGAIGLSLALECPGIEVVCTDISEAALEVARINYVNYETGFNYETGYKNAYLQKNQNGLSAKPPSRVSFLQGDWFGALKEQNPQSRRGYKNRKGQKNSQEHKSRQRFHLIVSNPPYISDFEELPKQVQDYEPAVALRGGTDGFEAVEKIINYAGEYLEDGGQLVVELAPNQAARARDLAVSKGYQNVQIHKDLAKRQRVLSCQKPGRNNQQMSKAARVMG